MAGLHSGRFGPLSSYPFAVLALSDVPFGPKKYSKRYITKDFLRKGTSIRHGHLRYSVLIKGYITKDVRGYFSKGTSRRAPVGDIFQTVHHYGPYRRTLLVIFCVVQTYFHRYLPSVGSRAFWACPLGHVKITPASENLRRDFSFSFLCKLFRKGPFRSISCAADFGRLVPPPFRG